MAGTPSPASCPHGDPALPPRLRSALRGGRSPAERAAVRILSSPGVRRSLSPVALQPWMPLLLVALCVGPQICVGNPNQRGHRQGPRRLRRSPPQSPAPCAQPQNETKKPAGSENRENGFRNGGVRWEEGCRGGDPGPLIGLLPAVLAGSILASHQPPAGSPCRPPWL